MAKRIAPHFSDELQAAGLLSLPFSWSETDGLFTPALTAQQRAAVEAVYAAHDPTDAAKAAAYTHRVTIGRITANRAAIGLGPLAPEEEAAAVTRLLAVATAERG
jgi:hypothetical protein